VTSAGESVYAFDLAEEGWRELAATARANKGWLRMHCCGTAAVMKRSKLGLQFFAHAPQAECQTAPETVHHLELKRLAVMAARRAGWQAEPEVRGGEGSNAWIADVLATKGRARVAIEIQWSPITAEELHARQARYRDAGIRGLWLLRQREFPISQDLPAALVEQIGGTYIAHFPGYGFESKSGDTSGDQETEARALVEQCLLGKVRWGFVKPGDSVWHLMKVVEMPCACGQTVRASADISLRSEVGDVHFDFGPIPVSVLTALRVTRLSVRWRDPYTRQGTYYAATCQTCGRNLEAPLAKPSGGAAFTPHRRFTVKGRLDVSDEMAEELNASQGPGWHLFQQVPQQRSL
jgi:hypothetical protein